MIGMPSGGIPGVFIGVHSFRASGSGELLSDSRRLSSLEEISIMKTMGKLFWFDFVETRRASAVKIDPKAKTFAENISRFAAS